MRLPWLQIDADGITKGRMLGRLLSVPESQGIGLAMELWRWALELAPEGDFGGAVPDAESMAAAVGWPPSDAGNLARELQRLGLIATVPTLRVRGLDRYRAAWEKNRRRGHRQDQPLRNTYPPALDPPGTRADQQPKTETETETDKKQKTAGKKPPAVRVHKPKVETPPDARHAPLVKALGDAGCDFRGGLDAKQVTLLLAKGEPAEVLVRWRRALAWPLPFPRVRTLTELNGMWAHFASDAPTGKGAHLRIEPTTQHHETGLVNDF